MITLVCAAVLYIASGALMGISDCWDYLKTLRDNKSRKEKP